jgi:N-acyl-D-aspartate/D-glutamate deacylase
LEPLVKRQTSETADFFGLTDRGRLAPGLRADVNVIDYEGLKLHMPELVHDMPAAGRLQGGAGTADDHQKYGR